MGNDSEDPPLLADEDDREQRVHGERRIRGRTRSRVAFEYAISGDYRCTAVRLCARTYARADDEVTQYDGTQFQMSRKISSAALHLRIPDLSKASSYETPTCNSNAPGF